MGCAHTPLKCGEAATDNSAFRIPNYALKRSVKLQSVSHLHGIPCGSFLMKTRVRSENERVKGNFL
jgi:hypothetical protein